MKKAIIKDTNNSPNKNGQVNININYTLVT